MKGFRGYAPGINSNPFPDNSGIFLPADVTFEFQVHYTPVGRATIDSTKMGILVSEKKPENEIFTNTMINTKIKIKLKCVINQNKNTADDQCDHMIYHETKELSRKPPQI